MRWALILAGGSGTRFWPLSTPDYPKQFLALAGDEPLLTQAVGRLHPLIPPERTLILTGANLAKSTRELLADFPADNVLAEPTARGTAPALTWGTSVVRARDPQASVVSLHADWWVGDDESFRSTVVAALDAAEAHDSLVTVGVVPSRPETGYGYIKPGEVLIDDVSKVESFVEKPDRPTAAKLITEGCLWNSGMFGWTVDRFFEETERHAPEIAPHLGFLPDNVTDFYDHVTPIVIDRSHFERSGRVVVLPGKFPWDDVGTWSALGRVRTGDEAGNVTAGEVHSIESRDCIVWTGGERVVLSGVSGLVVVRANGITLVTTLEGANQLKETLNKLPPEALEPRA